MIGSVLLWLTQPMLILTSLGAFVVILHALLVYAHPLSDEGWRRVDCIWLAGAVLSLLGMSAEARRQWVKLRKPISEQLHLGSVDYLRDSFLVLVQPVGVPLLHQVLADRLVGHRKDGVAHGAGGVPRAAAAMRNRMRVLPWTWQLPRALGRGPSPQPLDQIGEPMSGGSVDQLRPFCTAIWSLGQDARSDRRRRFNLG